MEERRETPRLDLPPRDVHGGQPPLPSAALPLGVRRSPGSPGWRSADILRATFLVVGVLLGLALLWVAHPLILTVFLAILFGLAVARGADHLERLRVPRGVGAALIVFGFWGLLAALFAWAAPTLSRQFGELRTLLPQAMSRVEAWVAAHRDGPLGILLGGGGAAPADLRATLSGQLDTATRYFFPFLSSTLAVLTGLLLVTFLVIYIAAEPRLYHRGLLHLVPHAARPRTGQVLSAVGTTLRHWLVTQLVAMVVIGVVTTVALLLLGVEAAVSLGIIAGLFEFIPTIGPLLAAVPAVLVGLLDSPQKALAVAIAYAAIQFLENHLLIPLLMKRGVDLPPAVTLVAQGLLAVVFGFLGLLVAVPLVAAVMVAVKMLYVEDVVGDEVAVLGEH